MEFAEGYEEGLNAFLNREINPRDLLDGVKGILYPITQIIPGVGLGAHYIKERRERKGKHPWYNLKETKDRKALGVYVLEAGYLAFAISWKLYVGHGLITKEWNPFKYSKDKTIQIKERKLERECTLEKTIQYEEIFTLPTENH
jgi:hypothetical protein